MNKEPQLGDPPELIAIKRAFKKVPGKLSYANGEIRFRYLSPMDFAPGVISILAMILSLAAFVPGAGGTMNLIWISVMSATVFLGCAYLTWLLPRLHTTVVLTKDGIGIERKGELVEFYGWNQISRMTVGMNPMSPIMIWSSTGPLSQIPALYTAFSITASDYRILQASILTAFSGASAPFFRDHVNEYELSGRSKWMRVGAPTITIAASVLFISIGSFMGSPFGWPLFFAFLPWIPLSGLWLIFALSEAFKYEDSKRTSKPLSIISVGNSNLGFDLRNKVLVNITSRTTYRSTAEPASRSRGGATILLILIVIITLVACLMYMGPFLAMFFYSGGTAGKIIASILALGIPTFIAATAVVSVRFEQLVRQDNGALLQFDDESANIIAEGKVIPITSFGKKKFSYEEFKAHPTLDFGYLRVNAGGKSYYFSPSKMVTISDHELMNYLPEFD